MCYVNLCLIVCVVLNVEQFHRFMEVIRKLGERVAKEHDQFLRDSQRLEDRSANKQNGTAAKSFAGSVDFETLVGTTGIAGKKIESVDDPGSWEDDVWGSIFSNGDGVSPCFDLYPSRLTGQCTTGDQSITTTPPGDGNNTGTKLATASSVQPSAQSRYTSTTP
jgi:hypothetical protein